MLELVNSGNKTARAAAVRNLIIMVDQGPEVIKALLPWLDDPNWAVDNGDTRGAIVRKLSDYQIPESVPGLIKILDERGKQERQESGISSNANRPMALTRITRLGANTVPSEYNGLPVNTMASSSNSAYYGPPVAYPYRAAAVNALAKQKDSRAAGALRRILPRRSPRALDDRQGLVGLRRFYCRGANGCSRGGH